MNHDGGPSHRNPKDKLKHEGDADLKSISILSLSILVALILSACGAGGAPAAPTVNPADLQGTISAAAFTVIAETQAAIPTATPVPPTATSTNTPLPTPTFLPVPSAVGTLPTASGGNSGGADPCINQTMPETLQGDAVRIRIDNSTKAKLSVSVYLNQAVPNGQCGYRSYTLDPGQSVVLNNLVEGCYTLWAWDPDPDNYFIVTNGTTCVDNSKNWTFGISTSSIKPG
jgi:hypothetical protein